MSFTPSFASLSDITSTKLGEPRTRAPTPSPISTRRRMAGSATEAHDSCGSTSSPEAARRKRPGVAVSQAESVPGSLWDGGPQKRSRAERSRGCSSQAQFSASRAARRWHTASSEPSQKMARTGAWNLPSTGLRSMPSSEKGPTSTSSPGLNSGAGVPFGQQISRLSFKCSVSASFLVSPAKMSPLRRQSCPAFAASDTGGEATGNDSSCSPPSDLKRNKARCPGVR
mmetsp:Transcript_24044/g.66870  ORF Transcript_24044/g.66870 Transcript_24044/m.66870 type:complete len:227 (-) Transcript_24044:583-1263(-)